MNAIKSLISEVSRVICAQPATVECAHGRQAIEVELISSGVECCFVGILFDF